MEQFGLLLGHRSHYLFQAEMDCQTERGQGGAQLMGDGGHQVALQLVKPSQPRHLLQDDCGPHDPSARLVHGSRSGQEIPVALVGRDPDRLLEPFGDVRPLAAEHMRAQPL